MGRISTGTVTIGIFAVMFGLIGAYALRAALVTEEVPPPPREQPIMVPLAASDLPADRTLAIGDMVLVPMSQEELSKREYPLQTLMISTDQIVGRVLKTPLKQGGPFLTTELYPEGVLPDPSAKLKPGLRAVTVPIDDLSAVGGTVQVGSIVDVLFRSRPRPADPLLETQRIPEGVITLLEGVEVIGVSYNTEATQDPLAPMDVRRQNRAVNTNSFRSVTLAVTPQEAAILKTVSGRGELSLVLRARPADGDGPNKMLTLEELLGLTPPQDPFELEVWLGTAMHSLFFDENNKLIRREGYGGYSGFGGVMTESSNQTFDASGTGVN